jgi:hypothetical protein
LLISQYLDHIIALYQVSRQGSRHGLTRRSSSHSSHSASRIQGQTTRQLLLSIETSRLGSSNINGLTLSPSTYTIERQSPRDISSSEPHIISGEGIGLCYISEGRGATLNLPYPARDLIPRTARSHTYVYKGGETLDQILLLGGGAEAMLKF